MKLKWPIFIVLLAFLVLLMVSASKAVDTRRVDEVLTKGVLDSQDLQIIDNFLDEAVRELVSIRDLTNIANVRTAILSRRSNQAQYAQQFSESAHKYISAGLREASGLTPPGRKIIVTVNLLILIDGLEDPRLTDLAVGKLNAQTTIVRYWAVHCLTSPAIIEKLNAGGESNLQLARRIVAEFSGLVEYNTPEIIALIARFAADVKVSEAEDLLLKIAALRIKSYADWKVKFELLDGIILKSLSSRLSSTASNNPAIARSFSQLYSYVIQRYVKGSELLSDTQKQQLVSIMVETEDKCITKLLGRAQTAIKRAIEANDIVALLREHNRLLGNETSAGQLPLKLNFDYGSSGDSSTAPIPLPEPPKAEPEI